VERSTWTLIRLAGKNQGQTLELICLRNVTIEVVVIIDIEIVVTYYL